jgi:tryptophan synthase alpha chain
VSQLGEALAASCREGRKCFLPYVTGGLPAADVPLLRGLEASGADAIEVGLPFSDPIMDGPVIQEASRRALEAGATPAGVLGLVREAALGIPVTLMTYLNPLLAYGEDRFVADASEAGASGLIVPDLPVDEAADWIGRCRARGVSLVLLAAPNTSPGRLGRIAQASDAFVYCVSTYGVTGARERLEGSAEGVVRALRRITEVPLMVGVGISSPAQALEACSFADGVVVGTALVQPLLEAAPERTVELAGQFRAACVRQ